MNERKSPVGEAIISVWWICWFGFIGSFLYFGINECRWEIPRRKAALPFSISLFVVVGAGWIAFFVADSKSTNRAPATVRMLTTMGTLLAVVTLWAVFFFVYIAPRVR